MYGPDVGIFTYFLVSGRETLILWHWDTQWLHVFRELTDCQRTPELGLDTFNDISYMLCVTPPFPIQPQWRIRTESGRETIYWDSLTCSFSELNLYLWLHKQFL